MDELVDIVGEIPPSVPHQTATQVQNQEVTGKESTGIDSLLSSLQTVQFSVQVGLKQVAKMLQELCHVDCKGTYWKADMKCIVCYLRRSVGFSSFPLVACRVLMSLYPHHPSQQYDLQLEG